MFSSLKDALEETKNVVNFRNWSKPFLTFSYLRFKKTEPLLRQSYVCPSLRMREVEDERVCEKDRQRESVCLKRDSVCE